ncbi:MAG: hypothetical protein LBJ81_01015 [Puniceicoccales bacterium]|jgi:hypothetical protein|nr:hypothetical protein [Puniceicoccales bacterium]
MRFKEGTRGFTVLEILIASAIMVAVVGFAAIGINTLLDYKNGEHGRSKLAYGALQILDEIEENWENRSVSLGNLLINEPAYPLQFRVDSPVSGYPSLSFFINSAEGPRAICYSLAPLPTALGGDFSGAAGLFRLILDGDESKAALENFSSDGDLSAAFPAAEVGRIANLLSDSAVFFEVHLIKLAADGFSLEYLNGDAQAIEVHGGKWSLGASHPTDIAFLEVAVGVLPKSFHGTYFGLSSVAEKGIFLTKNGIRLARLLPWHI